jgi:hypothetical protein
MWHARGKKRSADNVSVGKPERKTHLGSPLRAWEDNITADLREIRWDGVEWIHPSQDREHWPDPMNTIMTVRLL